MTTVRAVDCLAEIRQAAAELEAEGVPEPSDDVIRELAAIFRLARPAPRPKEGEDPRPGGRTEGGATLAATPARFGDFPREVGAPHDAEGAGLTG